MDLCLERGMNKFKWKKRTHTWFLAHLLSAGRSAGLDTHAFWSSDPRLHLGSAVQSQLQQEKGH